jgi:hypothetical protein
MGLGGGIRSGEGQVKPKATAKSNGAIVVGENVGVEKRISPLRCSQNTRAASVEMTISCYLGEENRQRQRQTQVLRLAALTIML